MKHIFRFFICTLIICTSLFAGEEFYFIIRVDDIQSRINWEPRRIIEFEQAVEARAAKISWAVIPHRLLESQNEDGRLADDLRNSAANGHEIIVHGYNHICPLCNQSSHEMYCTYYQTSHSYATQKEMLEDGLQILQDSLACTPNSFVPPGHHADSTTYNVLLENNFEWISTTAETKNYIHKHLYNLSPHNEFTWYLSQANYSSKLNAALDDIALKSQADGYYCLLLHDPFIRRGYENGLVINWTAELLDSLIARYGNNIQFSTLSEAAKVFHDGAVNIAHNNHQPQSEQILRNYPNPFNSSTVITYQLSNFSNVDLSIYNLLGQKAATLVSEQQAPGNYQVTLDAAHLASGVYIYSLKTAGAIIRKRMLLIK